MCIFYGISGKNRVSFMAIFKIGVKLLALQAEQIAVILSRPSMEGRSSTGDTGCKFKRCAAARQGEERLDSRRWRWPCPGTRRAGFRLSFMRCFAWDRPEGSAADLAGRPIERLGATVLEGKWCRRRWYVIKRSWERPGRLVGSLFRKDAHWWFVSSSARVVAG